MRPYSSVKVLCGLSYTCFTGTRVLGQSGETGSKFLKSYARTHEKQPKVFGSSFHIKWDFTLVSGPSVGRVIPASQELGYWGNLGKRVRMPKIMCKDIWKVIQSLQLLVSRQMRPYSSVKALCGSSYTCFTGARVLGQSGESGSKSPKSYAKTHEKQSKVFSSLFHIKWDFTLVSGPSVGWSILVSRVLGYWSNFGKVAPNTPNHMLQILISHQVSFYSSV